MRKLTFEVFDEGEYYGMEFITDRTAKWTMEQYGRNRNCTMNLIGDEQTNEIEATARKINLGE